MLNGLLDWMGIASAPLPSAAVVFGGIVCERASQWEPFRNAIVDAHPWCSGCGCTTRKLLTLHHIEPYQLHVKYPHLFPLDRELDASNVCVLCESPTLNCHLWLGHFGSFADSFNPRVVVDAATAVAGWTAAARRR